MLKKGGFDVLDKMVRIEMKNYIHICIFLGVPENMCEKKSNKISFYKFI